MSSIPAELPADYKRIEDHYTRAGRLWLWCCAQVVKMPGFWRLYRHGYPRHVEGGDVWLYFMSRAYTWGEIKNERKWWPR